MTSRMRAVEVMLREGNCMNRPDILGLTEDELGDKYNLEPEDASNLWWVLHDDDADKSVYRLPEESGQKFLELVQESIHQGIDGFTDQERFVIRRYLADIAYGLSVI